MAQIREIKKRIKSVESTQRVTHAMELVEAAKMRKSQVLALSGRPYTFTLHEILKTVQGASKSSVHRLLEKNTSIQELLIVVTSDRGLAGGLNLNVFREILRSELKNTKFITIGKKARDFAAKTNQDLIASYGSEEIPFLTLARILTKMVTKAYANNEYSKISIIYPHFDSTIKQNPRWVQLLPIEDETNQPSIINHQPSTNLLFEPSADSILSSILIHHVLTQIYQVLVESKASEHSARMVAMKNATDAAEDLVKDLTLTYNQARQEAITKELLDMITAQRAFE
ncbi:MAG: ATP synthase F1 subunit gamma [Patescibacteria group bacterium]